MNATQEHQMLLLLIRRRVIISPWFRIMQNVWHVLRTVFFSVPFFFNLVLVQRAILAFIFALRSVIRRSCYHHYSLHVDFYYCTRLLCWVRDEGMSETGAR